MVLIRSLLFLNMKLPTGPLQSNTDARPLVPTVYSQGAEGATLREPKSIETSKTGLLNPLGSTKPVPSCVGFKAVAVGMIEMSINFPTDYVKTQLQLDERSARPKYKGIVDVVRYTLRHHGVRGLYTGLNIAILNPKTAVRFTAFVELKKRSVDRRGNLSPAGRLLCGFGAGVIEGLVAVTPIESIKIKFIHDQNYANKRYNGLVQGIKQIVENRSRRSLTGIRGLYQGVVPTVIKTSTNQAIRFFVVETLKDWKRKGVPRVRVSKPLTAGFGAVGVALSVILNTPVDVVKSRMQGLEASQYRSTVHCAQQILAKEGPLAFYKGVISRLERVPIEVAILFSVNDTITEMLNEIL